MKPTSRKRGTLIIKGLRSNLAGMLQGLIKGLGLKAPVGCSFEGCFVSLGRLPTVYKTSKKGSEV